MPREIASRSKRAAVQAFGAALEPLVGVLLDVGLTASEAEEVLRDVFVKSARKMLRETTGRASTSQVALRCGLYRSDVKERLTRIDAENPALTSPDEHRLSRLLFGWHRDPDYVGRDGRPKRLSIDGPRSFSSLVARYAANMYPAVVLRELERVGAIRRDEAGQLEALSSEYAAGEFDEDRIVELGARARDAIDGLVSYAKSPRGGRTVVSSMGFEIDQKYLPLLRATIRSRARSFARLLDEELSDPKRRAQAGGSGVRIGLLMIGVETPGPSSQGILSGESTSGAPDLTQK